MGWLASDVRGATDPTALPASGGTTWPPAIEPPLLPPTSARSECLGHHHLPCSYPATHHASRVREIGRATTNSVVASGPPSAHPKHPGRRSIVCTTSPPARTRTHRWAGTSPYYGEMKIPWRVRFPSAPLPGTLALARRDSSPPAVQHPVGRTKPLIDTGWVSEPSRIYTMGSIALLAERFLMSSSPLRWSSVCWLSQALMAPFLTAAFQGSGPPGGLGAHSRGRRAITGGSPPASSHPATLAMSGSPARMTNEVDGGDATERAEVAAVPGEQGGVRAGGSEDRSKQGERTGGGAREGAACGAARPGGGQGAQIVRRLAADQPDGHPQHAECQKDARGS